ncbi:MAG: amino acid adenylation domain-containing protein [Lachnospiraceae bacterium]|nr:amino acid adenylation domain-containing protein [Lachnospiraceae bacterium]
MNEYLKLLCEASENFGEEPAIVDHGGSRITDYATFGDLMRRTATWINNKQLGKRSFIPVMFDSSMEFAAAVCGVWLSGHIAVPMGTSFPPERVKFISMNCDAPFIVDGNVIDEIRGTDLSEDEVYPDSDEKDTALLLYTSGSTGMPKGILHTFEGLYANRQLGKPEVYSKGQRWAMGAPLYFVASVAVYKVLTFGGCVHLMDEETMRDVRKLEDYYEEQNITVGFISPSVLSNFHNRAQSLKLVMTGSERLTGQCSRDGYKLFNNYGMSETMGTVCSFLVEQPYDTTPVGIPPEGTVWALLDDDMNPVPDGEEGEYCTKGPYTIGYYKNPEATEKLFRGGWLHTGDILKKLPDGNLLYINRKDWMVKINGQRVEPGEIENVLRALPGIDMAVVKAVKGAEGQVALCAYYTGEVQEEATLREGLSRKLAEYMVPSFFMHLDEFPLNANNKIDRKNLPEPDLMSRRSEYAAPENETESMICRAFEEALGMDRVGIDDDFFAMGGDSIRVMKLVTACPELDLSSKMIYSGRTPRKIAESCIASGSARVREKKEVYPLSASQMGIYIESMNRDGEALYNNPILLKLGKDIDMEKLKAACEAAVDAHPFIKVRLSADEDGNPLQHRNDAESYSQTIEKISDKDLKDLMPKLMQPFRLLKDRLFRIRLFETEEDKYLFTDLHHIIFDGASMLVLMKDIERAYMGEALETETYSGFEVAEDEKLRSDERYDEAKEWYEKTFGGLEVDSLPVPNRKLGERAFHSVTMDLALEASEVEALCRKYDITENIFATAAFGICAGLYAGSNEALFTTIYNGRDSLRTARTVAMLVKTLPVYSHFEKDQEIRDYLGKAKEQMIGCMNNDIYPFSELAVSYGISSDLLFVYQGDILKLGGFADQPVERIPLMDNATGEQIAIQMYKQGGLYNVRAEYRSDLYSEEFIRILLKSYQNVLDRMLTAETVGEVSLADYEVVEQLKEWNRTETDYDRTQTVVSLFKNAAEKYPGNIAVIYEEEALTYKEVDARSDAIAAYIQRSGLGTGDVVSILIPRGIYQVVASLGALKAGCAYQPLDGTYPTERLNFMVNDASAKLLITTEELGSIITEYNGARLTLDEIEALPEGKPTAKVAPEDLFILLYTSGSTGVPKGVKLTHGNLVCFINWYRDYYDLTENDRVGQYASYGFDACMMDMYPALSYGAATCIVPEDMRLDLAFMNEYFIKNKVSLAFMTTQVGRQYAVEMKNPYMRAVSVGGEKLASMDPPKGVELHNGYGPTECTIFSTIYRVTAREDNIPIGKPLSDLKCYVIDAFGHLVPPGALGELLIAGPHVGVEYLGRPDKTAEVFVSNPFDGGEYEKAYKTGDVVRFRTDGEIEFIGRRDGQVKIHGFRIELSEVEAVIRDYEGVRNAAVVAKDLGADGKAIAAYYVSDAKIDPADIAAFIRERKPPYMVPASLMQIDVIPLNQNGKVNKAKLPEPVFTPVEEDTSHVDNVLETELKKVIGEAINMEEPPLNTPLEYLGLTSLGTIRLSTKLFKRFGVNINVKEFKDITITGIENIILNEWLKGGVTVKGDTPEEEDMDAVPLSAAQMGVYLDCMKQPDSSAYNIPSVMVFDAGTDPERLTRAVGEILMAHPSVFVHFDIVDNQVMAVKDEAVIPEIPLLEMTEDEVLEYQQSFVKPFHLNRGPLFEASIVKTPEAVRLYTDFHHLIFDGFSMNIFLKNMETAMKGEGKGPEKESASYFTYARNQKEMLSGERSAEYEEYFGKLLENFESSTELPGLISSTDAAGEKAFLYQRLDERTLKKACGDIGTTEASFCLAALDYTLARLTASDNVYISTISSGRSDVRFSDTFGMFVNTIPLAAVLSDGTTGEFVKEVAGGFDKALEHENYPFAEIAGKWGLSVNVMYEYQRGVVEKPDIPGLVRVQGFEPVQTKFGITVRIVDRDNEPAVEVEYNNAAYTKKTVEDFIRSYYIAINEFAKHIREKVRSISLLDEERAALLDSFRERPVKPDIPSDVLFHSGIERFAKEKPDHPAIRAVDGDYTYKELDETANRVANALIGRGVKKGDRLVLLMPRTAEFFFALYGVLKAGATYIPCDPNYPVERIRHIIDDSKAAYIITTQERIGRFKDRKALDIRSLVIEDNVSKPDVEISQDDLAYMIYTSGSTGKPKGVMLKHRGIVNYVTNTPGNILVNGMVGKGHVLTAVTTFSFDFSIKEWGMPLFNGLTLSVAGDDEINDASKLAARMKATGTDVFGSTPSRIMTLMESEEFKSALENCKVLICGGEKYPEALLKALKEGGKGDRLIFNTYGPTETTVSSNTQELSESDTVNAGPPLPGVREYIVDNDGNKVPPGVIGELYIGGLGVATGYNELPEMTADRFIDYHGERVYKSGDYARWTADGNVEIIGRRDNQIKLRGLRIELDEVESVLSSVSGIGRATVRIEKINGIEHLCAWFTADHPVDIGELKKELGRTLTNYMVPTAYMQLEEMPVTPNGKLDMKSLPIPELYRSGDAAKASTPAEQAFCDIFSELLHVEDVGVNEDFFDLGGTSLLVTNVVIEAGTRGYNISFGDVFDNPTPGSLAALTGDGLPGNAGGAGKAGEKDIRDYDYDRINGLLKKNTLEGFKSGALRETGTVLLTGTVGYLGIHVLHELLSETDGVIYCLHRSQADTDATERLKRLYFYYFDTDISGLVGKRLMITDGDVTDPGTFEQLAGCGIDTVINCAAVVKHFASGTIIEDVNVGGAVNLIDFCLKTGAAMIQTSTMSVVTSAYKDNLEQGFEPDEQSLYFEQVLDNKYIHSKFLAERAVLEAVAEKGLKGKILRFGNLAARHSDGEFQINFDSNSAMGRLRAFSMLGCATFDQLDGTMEFSPIDAVAKALVLLTRTPDDCTVFHVFNNQSISMEGIFHELSQLGYPIRYVERPEFAKAFSEAQKDPAKATELTSIMAYMQSPGGREQIRLQRKCEYTMQVLYRLGFRWPVTTWDYIQRFVSALSGLGYFDE